jgi:uncharacterized protein YneF (UPF0154 family)
MQQIAAPALGDISMFETTGLVITVIVIKLLVGAITGLVIAWVILRSKITRKPAILAAIASSVLLILGSGLVGYASAHEAWLNGKRLDVAPSGEDLRWRNRIAEYEALICFGPSALAAGAIAFAFRKRVLPTRTA